MARRSLLAALVAVLALAAPAAACPFCGPQGQSLSGEVGQADFIVLGTLSNPQRDPNDFTKGTTDMSLDVVVKPHPFLAGKKKIVLPRVVPVSGDGSRFLVFCSLYTRPVDYTAAAVVSPVVLANFDAAQLDAYRGEPVAADSKLGDYLKGAIEVRTKPPVEQLRYFFDYLDATDPVVSVDALNEFAAADYAAVRAVAEKLPADKVLKWIKDPNTPASRLGLYGLFLSHCGSKDDAAAVHALLTDKTRGFTSGLDGLLAAYIMLDKKAGWDYLLDLVKNPKAEFPVRYAALKTLRFFWEYRPDVISHAQVLEGIKPLVAQSDMADLPIEDLRKWGVWDLTGFVLNFANEKAHNDIPIVRRSILRFALTAPAGTPGAAEHIAMMRMKDPDRVKQVEDALEVEKPRPPSGAAPK